jgi:hypothetical protein
VPHAACRKTEFFNRLLVSSCPELAFLANPDAAFEKCDAGQEVQMSRCAGMRESDVQMPCISMANALEMSAHPCAELVAVQNSSILDSN